MRALALASCLSLAVALPAAAQEAPLMPTPPPTDFTKPFQYDRAHIYFPGAEPRRHYEEVALPVEVIGRDELLRLGDPSVEDLARHLSEIGFVQRQGRAGAAGKPAGADRSQNP